jgi:hypothetical protein
MYVCDLFLLLLLLLLLDFLCMMLWSIHVTVFYGRAPQAGSERQQKNQVILWRLSLSVFVLTIGSSPKKTAACSPRTQGIVSFEIVLLYSRGGEGIVYISIYYTIRYGAFALAIISGCAGSTFWWIVVFCAGHIIVMCVWAHIIIIYTL